MPEWKNPAPLFQLLTLWTCKQLAKKDGENNHHRFGGYSRRGGVSNKGRGQRSAVIRELIEYAGLSPRGPRHRTAETSPIPCTAAGTYRIEASKIKIAGKCRTKYPKYCFITKANWGRDKGWAFRTGLDYKNVNVGFRRLFK